MKPLATLLEELPGMELAGYISHPRVNGGESLPVLSFKSKERDINTAEGWAEFANRCNRLSFIDAHGREPVDMNEVYAWIECLTGRRTEVAPK